MRCISIEVLGLSKWNREEYNIVDDFHTYVIEWKPDQIDWYYDGDHYFTVTRADVGDREWVFEQPFFIILNLALGGQLPGPIGFDTVFPTQFLVGYVRVYQAVDPRINSDSHSNGQASLP
jgi:beta-glucanase (GH16 family)